MMKKCSVLGKVLLLGTLAANLLIILLCETLFVGNVYASCKWQVGGLEFGYRRPVTIDNTGNSNNLNDYQVLVTVDTASLISNGKMQSDCDDIRFTDSDGTTLLNYWIEPRTCNTSSTKIWVKVPLIPASSTKTIYMYYGNSSATSASDGDATFLFFDDMENWSGWTQYGSGQVSQDSTRAYEGTYSAHKTTACDPSGAYKALPTTLGRDIILEAWVYRAQATSYTRCPLDRIGLIDSSGNGYGSMAHPSSSSYGIDVRKKYKGSLNTFSGSNLEYDVWYQQKLIIVSNGTVKAEFYDADGNRLASGSITDNSYSSFTNFYIFGGHDYWVDLVRIRKYTYPEPTTRVGGEQHIAGLFITKEDSPDPVTAGDTLTYTLTVTNNGPCDASNVTVTDNVTTEIQNPEYSTDNGSTWSSWTGSINIGTLAAGASQEILIRGTVDPSATGTISNTASVSSDTSDPDTTNNSATQKTSIKVLFILIPNHTGTAKPCGEKIYIHTIRNNSDNATYNFNLSANSSIGLSHLFYLVDDNGTIIGGPITSIQVGPGEQKSFAIRLFIPCNTPENSVDTTKVTATTTVNSTSISQTVTNITTITTSELNMKKEVRNVTDNGTFSDQAGGKPGEILEYRIIFQNYSTQDLFNVTISDPIPPFTDLVPDAYNAGAYPVWIHFTFANGTTQDCYTNATNPVVTVDIPASCGVTTLKPGEKGELYYQVKIKD